MIVCHKYKFIFVKTKKTAGTSVEIALSKFCGDGDIITPNRKVDEDLRRNLGYRTPQNYLKPLPAIERYKRKIKKKLGIKTDKREKLFYHHIPAHVAKQQLGDQIWNTYYKFCIERNPWDKVISGYYFYKGRDGLNDSLDEFILSGRGKRHFSDYKRYYHRKEGLLVDRIIRYENLQDELDQIAQHLGLPEKIDLPKAKSEFRSDRRHYSETLSEAAAKRISRDFSKEIKLMDYKF